MAEPSALRELQAAFPDHGADELAAVLAAHNGRGDLAAESLLAEALVGAVHDVEEEDGLLEVALGDGDAGRAGRTSEQVRADEEYARLLQVGQARRAGFFPLSVIRITSHLGPVRPYE